MSSVIVFDDYDICFLFFLMLYGSSLPLYMFLAIGLSRKIKCFFYPFRSSVLMIKIEISQKKIFSLKVYLIDDRKLFDSISE